MNDRLPKIPPQGTVAIPTADAQTTAAGGQSFATRDHQAIKAWATRHGAEPATGEGTASGPATINVQDGGAGIRFNFPGFARFRPISWDEWFEHFDSNHLVFVYGEEVADRAYERWQHRGGEHGHDREDWFASERELRAEAGTGSGRYRFLPQKEDEGT